MGIVEIEEKEVHIKYVGGNLEIMFDFQEAWEKFITSPTSWNISWTAKNGRRIRITKKEPRIFEFNYIRDIINGTFPY